MPKLINLWECQVCGSQWETEEVAKKCEEKHKKVVSCIPMYNAYSGCDDHLPDCVKVTFEDGTTMEYRYD